MRKIILPIAAALMFVLTMCPTLTYAQNQDNEIINLMKSNIRMIQNELPVEIEPELIYITDMTLEEKCLSVTFKVFPTTMSTSFAILKKDVMENYQEGIIKKLTGNLSKMLISQDLGIVLKFQNGDNERESFNISVSSNELCSILGINKSKLNIYELIISQEIVNLKRSLPVTVENGLIEITSIEINGNFVEYAMKMRLIGRNNDLLSKENIESDYTMARLLSRQEEFLNLACNGGYGIKMLIRDMETSDIVLNLEISPERLKRIYRKIQNEDIKPYTTMEILKNEIDAMSFPVRMAQGLTMTNAYIDGNDVYYISCYDKGIHFDIANLEHIKKTMVISLQNSELTRTNERKQEIIDNNIVLHYIYKNSDGVTESHIKINHYDLFGM